jgi:hypothetical protein
MSPERSHAYRRVLETIQELGPSKLQPAEQDQIRLAADSLLFCGELTGDAAAQEALIDSRLLCDRLTESGRWQQVTADRLAEDIRACGPESVREPVAA